MTDEKKPIKLTAGKRICRFFGGGRIDSTRLKRYCSQRKQINKKMTFISISRPPRSFSSFSIQIHALHYIQTAHFICSIPFQIYCFLADGPFEEHLNLNFLNYNKWSDQFWFAWCDSIKFLCFSKFLRNSKKANLWRKWNDVGLWKQIYANFSLTVSWNLFIWFHIVQRLVFIFIHRNFLPITHCSKQNVVFYFMFVFVNIFVFQTIPNLCFNFKSKTF